MSSWSSAPWHNDAGHGSSRVGPWNSARSSAWPPSGTAHPWSRPARKSGHQQAVQAQLHALQMDACPPAQAAAQPQPPPQEWAHGEDAWNRTEQHKLIAKEIKLWNQLLQHARTPQDKNFYQEKLAGLRMQARSQQPQEERLQLAMKEVAECRVKSERAMRHAEEAQAQVARAASMLEEAERNLEEVKQQQALLQQPAGSYSGVSSAAQQAQQEQLLDGVSSIADMLSTLLTVGEDGDGRLTLPKDALRMAHNGLRQLQTVGFTQPAPQGPPQQQVQPVPSTPVSAPTFTIHSDEEMDPGPSPPSSGKGSASAGSGGTVQLQRELSSLVAGKVVRRRITSKKPYKALKAAGR